MIDLRYHIASLVAVFLALAVGIVIGASMMGTPSVENQIHKLKTGFDAIKAEDSRLREENQAVRDQAKVLDQALRQVVPAVVRDRLVGKRIAIVICGPEPDASLLREIKGLVTAAGATVKSKTTFEGSLLPENAGSRIALAQQTAADPQDSERAQRQIAAYVVRQIVSGADAEAVTTVGRYSPGLVLDGDYSAPADAVILLAGPATQEEADAMEAGRSVQARIADTLREQGTSTVVCEQQACPLSLMPHFTRYNLTTVDGVDTALGKIALIYALAGKQGHFGTKPAATQVLPDLDIAPATAATSMAPSGAHARPPAHSPRPAHPGLSPQSE